MKRFNITQKSKVWALIACGVVLVSLLVFWKTAKYSEEFTGGINLTFNSQESAETIQTMLTENSLILQNYQDVKVNVNKEEGEITVKVNANLPSDDEMSALSKDVQAILKSNKIITSAEDLNGQTLIGPSVGSYMKSTAFKALIVGVVLMVFYMLFAFGRIRKEIPAEVLVATVLCVLVFDICTTLGAYAVWMMLNPTIQVDTIFITALLTIVAYGINDVIVLFDRIRENIIKGGKEKTVQVTNIIEESLWQTMRRSLGTSFSTLLVLIGMFIFASGAAVLQQFAFTVGMGIIFSTCASIFLGGSLTNLFMQRFKKKTK